MKYIIIIITTAISAGCFADNDCSILRDYITLNFYLENTGNEPNDFDPNAFNKIEFGHTDVDISFTSAGWDSHYKVMGNRIDYDSGLIWGNSKTHYNSVPAGYEFTGASSGDELWVLPQSSMSGAVYLGFNTENSISSNLCNWDPNYPGIADRSAKWYKVTLKDVRGPQDGVFSMWQTGPLTVYMSSADEGITEDDAFFLTAGAHTHMNWGFSKPGYYQLDFIVETVYQCDTSLYSDIWPSGNGAFKGDCKIDLYDLTLLAQYWLSSDCPAGSECAKADIYTNDESDDFIEINIQDLQLLAGQWLICGYPGCN